MYQTQDDMLEDEYLRKRIRTILKGQVRARGYGNSWNAELGPRNYPNENEGSQQLVPFNEEDVLGGEVFEEEYEDLYSLAPAQPRRRKGGVVVGGVAVGGARKLKGKSDWNRFVSAHKGKGYSLQKLGEMFRGELKVPARGGAVINDLRDYTLKEIRGFIRLHNKGRKDKIRNYSKLNRKQLLRRLNDIGFRVNIKETATPPRKSATRQKKRGLSDWQQFMRVHKGKGYNSKQLSTMYRNRDKGGVVIQAKDAQLYSGPREGDNAMGGIYLR